MPFVHRLGERVGDAGTYADQRSLLDAELRRDLVGGAEADAADVPGQPVRVLRDELDCLGAVGLVDAHRARGADAVAVQEPTMRSARFGPIPVTSRRRPGSCSMT